MQEEGATPSRGGGKTRSGKGGEEPDEWVRKEGPGQHKPSVETSPEEERTKKALDKKRRRKKKTTARLMVSNI